MYSPQKFIEKPLNLLSFDSLGHAILNKKAIDFIESIPKPISILSIAGPYRTGKSYLLNSIISGEERFPVSSTTSSCTKGLWIWGKPLLSVDQQGKITNVLVIDTQGFGCLDQVYDKRIIILALLLSTCFIYNSKGNIDKSAMQDLHYVIEQTKKIKREMCFDSVTDFHWILRDFHLQLVNELELQIPSNQYMQKCLKQYSQQNQNQREAYRLLCNFFRNRNCHTFVTPQLDSNLEQNSQFLQQLLKFKKILNGIPSLNLSGNILSQILQAYVSAMNEDLGLEREGTQCRLRLNCMSQLSKQLENISQEQQIEKRQKMIKFALSEVEDTVISKMTSEKQIKILKEDINTLISEYGENTNPATTKQLKVSKQSKNAIHIIKQKQLRVATQPSPDLSSEKEIKIANKIELQAAFRIRQELQAKIYISELTIQQLTEDVKKLTSENQSLSDEKKQLQEKVNSLNDQMVTKEKDHALEKFELNQLLENLKKEKLLSCSSLQKQNELLKEKIQFLEERLACLEIEGMESSSGLTSRYAQKIFYLEKENSEMSKKHQKQIEELKEIYRKQEEKIDEEKKKELISSKKLALGEQIKSYLQEISKLQSQNSHLMIIKTQLQNEKFGLQNMYEQLKQNSATEIELLEKKLRQNEESLNQLHSNQISFKDKIIKEYQIKLEKETKILREELQLMSRKMQERESQANQTVANLENELDKLQQQWITATEELEINQGLIKLKEKEIESLVEKLQEQRQLNCNSYNSNFDAINSLHTQIKEYQNKLEEILKENKDLKEAQSQMRAELQEAKAQYNQHSEERKNIYDMEIARLEQKITALANTNNNLKEINSNYEELKSLYDESEATKKSLALKIEEKDRKLKGMDEQISSLKQQSAKLEGIIEKLTNSISFTQSELQQISEKSSQKLQSKQTKYMELLSKYHDKEKQYQILAEQLRSTEKQIDSKQKQLRKQMNEKVEEKNEEIVGLRQDLENQSKKMNEFRMETIKTRQQLQLSSHKLNLIEDSYQRKMEEYRDETQREIQRLNAKISHLQSQLKKVQEEKQKLEKTVTIYENDARETCSTITLMRNKYDKHCQQYQANLKLMRKKINELEAQDKDFKTRIQKYTHQIQYLYKNKQLLEQNYGEDFKLWSGKIKTFQQQVIMKN